MTSRGGVRSADNGMRKMDLGVEMRGYDVQGELLDESRYGDKKDGFRCGDAGI